MALSQIAQVIDLGKVGGGGGGGGDIDIDPTPIEGSTNAVSSGGVYDALVAESSARTDAITGAIEVEVQARDSAIESAIASEVAARDGAVAAAIADEVANRNAAINGAITTEVQNRNNAILNSANTKVDKVTGKGLSTNDLTDELIESIQNNPAVPTIVDDTVKYTWGSVKFYRFAKQCMMIYSVHQGYFHFSNNEFVVATTTDINLVNTMKSKYILPEGTGADIIAYGLKWDSTQHGGSDNQPNDHVWYPTKGKFRITRDSDGNPTAASIVLIRDEHTPQTFNSISIKCMYPVKAIWEYM